MTNVDRALSTVPPGLTGLTIAPWAPDEVYGVAAKWSDAAAPVYRYAADGWTPTGRQVADYRHSPFAALAEELTQALVASYGDGGGLRRRLEELARRLASEAIEF